jgi:hypothetical protein
MSKVIKKVATANNKFSTEAKSLNESGQRQNLDRQTLLITTLSGEMNSLEKEIKAISITDQQLAAMQTRFAELYAGLSNSLNLMAIDTQKKDNTAYQKNRSTLKTVAAKENPLIDDFNNYCKYKKKE